MMSLLIISARWPSLDEPRTVRELTVVLAPEPAPPPIGRRHRCETPIDGLVSPGVDFAGTCVVVAQPVMLVAARIPEGVVAVISKSPSTDQVEFALGIHWDVGEVRPTQSDFELTKGQPVDRVVHGAVGDRDREQPDRLVHGLDSDPRAGQAVETRFAGAIALAKDRCTKQVVYKSGRGAASPLIEQTALNSPSPTVLRQPMDQPQPDPRLRRSRRPPTHAAAEAT